ncbi:MAG: DUF488 family protein [Cellulosilyticaceae bacterium]
MIVYTIGHSNYPLVAFVKRLEPYHIHYVVDIRGTPYSKYNIEYNKERIGALLKAYGLGYIYMGQEFAAQRRDKSLYTVEGYADFEQVENDVDFLQGIRRLKEGIRKGYQIVLMGARQNPVECHRVILVGRYLMSHGFEVRHILHEGGWCTQKEMEQKLLQYYHTDAMQLPLDLQTGQLMDEQEILRVCYAKANRSIGYRVEKLKG